MIREFAILLLLSAAPCRAAFCSSASSEPRHDFQFFAGYSPVSATLIGTTIDRRLFLAGFGYAYRCWTWPAVSISYTGELMPAAVLLEPSHAVYGFAVTPLGFRAEFGRHSVAPFLETNEGIIASSETHPDQRDRRDGAEFFDRSGRGSAYQDWRASRSYARLQVFAHLQWVHERGESGGG
jgi:hypothetical protein